MVAFLVSFEKAYRTLGGFCTATTKQFCAQTMLDVQVTLALFALPCISGVHTLVSH